MSSTNTPRSWLRLRLATLATRVVQAVGCVFVYFVCCYALGCTVRSPVDLASPNPDRHNITQHNVSRIQHIRITSAARAAVPYNASQPASSRSGRHRRKHRRCACARFISHTRTHARTRVRTRVDAVRSSAGDAAVMVRERIPHGCCTLGAALGSAAVCIELCLRALCSFAAALAGSCEYTTMF